MGTSFLTRLGLTLLIAVISTLVWEAHMGLLRYLPETGALGGFAVAGDRAAPAEPGAHRAGPGVDRAALVGARYDVLTPRWPLTLVLGPARRVRLKALLLTDPTGAVRVADWSGGEDPVAQFLRATRLVTATVFPRIQVQTAAIEIDRPLEADAALVFGDDGALHLEGG